MRGVGERRIREGTCKNNFQFSLPPSQLQTPSHSSASAATPAVVLNCQCR